MSKEIKDHRWVHLPDHDAFIRKSAIIRIGAGKDELGSILFLEDGKTYFVKDIAPEDFFEQFLAERFQDIAADLANG